MQLSHYIFVLITLVAVALLEISAVRSNKWIVFKTPSSSPLHLTSHYGLFQRCDKASLSFLKGVETSSDLGSWSFIGVGNQTSLLTSRGDSLIFKGSEVSQERRGEVDDAEGWKCRRFPSKDDCKDGEDDFCMAWRSSAYISLLSLFCLLTSIISTTYVLFIGGRLKRATGWRMISGTLCGSVLLQIASMALIAYIFNNDEQFYSGCKLSTGFFVQTFTWTLGALITGSLVGVGYHNEKVEIHGGVGGDGYRSLE